MSVIVAIKENGVVYMGADSQTTTGSYKTVSTNQSAVKINRLANGILAGFCGRVAVKQEILSMDGVFTLDEEGNLTKRHIVTQIIPRLADKLDLFSDEESGELSVSIVLAHKDKLYRIGTDLSVIKLNSFTSSGAGRDFTYYAIESTKGQAVKDRILTALYESAMRCDSVCPPFVLIDTQSLEYEIYDNFNIFNNKEEFHKKEEKI